MKIVFDCNAMAAWALPDGDNKARIEHLVKGSVVVICPTPVIAEFLVGADATASSWLAALERKSNFKAADFNRRAATQCAETEKTIRGKKTGKRGNSKKDWQAVKIDRQIIAIAKINGAQLLISNDQGLKAAASEVGLTCCAMEELPLPESAKQQNLPLQDPN